MSSRPETHALYARLQEVLGDEHAATLITFLPPQPAGELATKADVADLKAEIAALSAHLKKGLERVNDRIDGLHYSLADQLRAYTIVMIGALTALAAILGTVFAIIFA